MLAWWAKVRQELRELGEYRPGRHGSFWHRFALTCWDWTVTLCKFEDHWALHVFCLWLTLWESRSAPYEIVDTWGIQVEPLEYVRLCWGARSKFLYLPWSWLWQKTEVLCWDKGFVVRESVRRNWRFSVRPGPAEWIWLTPYHYKLQSGQVQARLATVRVERRTWVWRWCAWLGWPRHIVTSISVDFDEEIGERCGTWKGGTVGCGYTMQLGETPEACLRRMEIERLFN
jgi:hypothetical protein